MIRLILTTIQTRPTTPAAVEEEVVAEAPPEEPLEEIQAEIQVEILRMTILRKNITGQKARILGLEASMFIQ